MTPQVREMAVGEPLRPARSRRVINGRVPDTERIWIPVQRTTDGGQSWRTVLRHWQATLVHLPKG